MLNNENIICISSIDWDFIWQGHQEIMSTLAKNGNRVLFIENTGVRVPTVRDIPRITNRIKNWLKGVKGIRKEADNLYIYSPLVFPFPYFRMARWINSRSIISVLGKWMKVVDFSNPIVWTFLPTPLSLDIADNLMKKILIYYCIDNFGASSKSVKKIRKSEKNLLKKADLVFVTSQTLYDYCSRYNDKVYIFPFTVNFEEFEKARLKKDSAIDKSMNFKKPIIGYVGGIHRWLDLNLIKETAKKYPDYSFVFLGPIQTNVSLLSGLKNIHFLGKKDHKEIPFFISHFDVCVIPYLITEYTKNVYPTKLNEYHAMGKPVVSTNLPEIINFNRKNDNLVLASRTYEEFMGNISKAISEPDAASVHKRISSAKINGWGIRIEEMVRLIEDTIDKKSKMLLDWRESFLEVYRKTRKKILNISLISLSIYFLIFYTPLVWFLAGPLKISQPPQKADCIVVLGGGVGESGKAGQGYEERVQYAVELYKQRYADNLIFSSGYMHVYREPLVMKALAVSQGVPQEAIILENEAKNTFENVKFTKEILNKNSWDKIILVSSPYHMRRASLVFAKIAKDIQVAYAPIKNSLFYLHPDRDIRGKRIWKRINLEQIRGIWHEYLGIVYYRYKGWI